GWNWRLTFLLFAVPGLVWAAWFWKWFRDEPGEHPSVNEAEVELIRDDHATGKVSAPNPNLNPTLNLRNSRSEKLGLRGPSLSSQTPVARQPISGKTDA